MLVHILGTESVEYVPIESFVDRVECENAIITRSIVIDDKYRLEFTCIKTDEEVS